MAEADIDFWFTIGSTYTCLTVMRLEQLERSSGLRFRWRPFNLRAVLAAMKHVPFADKPAKLAYMWRDLGRRANLLGLHVKVPAPYPIDDAPLANRIAVLGMDEGWGKDFVGATYRRWFVEGQDPTSKPALTRSLSEAGQDPARVLAAANSVAAEARLAAETEAAIKLGIFGSPNFVVDGELFWGDDRLEDAIQWRRKGSLRA